MTNNRRQKRDFMVAFQLSAVRRYSRDHMTKPESVLEHIGFCTFYGLLLAQRLSGAGHSVDFEQLFKNIATHDLDEAILGDIPRTTKYFNASIRDEFKKIENATIGRLGDWLGEVLLDDWVQAKDGFEGSILKVVDIAAVVFRNWIELEQLGNRSFLRVAVETQKFLVEFDRTSLIPELREELEAIAEINYDLISKRQPVAEDYMFLEIGGK